jgi:hypothetical protein
LLIFAKSIRNKFMEKKSVVLFMPKPVGGTQIPFILGNDKLDLVKTKKGFPDHEGLGRSESCPPPNGRHDQPLAKVADTFAREMGIVDCS